MIPSTSTVVTEDALNACEPVSLELAKANARVVVDDEDALIRRKIAAARKAVEDESGLHLVRKTVRHRLTHWPGNVIEIPAWPLVSVESITYRDAAGVVQTLDPATYNVDVDRRPGVIWLAPDASWPALQANRSDAVTITGTVGFDAVENPPPEYAAEAIQLLVAHWYRNREAAVIGTINSELEVGYQRLLDLLSETRYP